ncbi:MAG TPA: SDR family oxidoreductase [Aggregatilineales bacterium]|nr:SDR family oxidoreductase [Anaerolineales bacterium]HRE49080.1 SDR family oxidoreductase [Aggregatilineales bacterium]
MTNRVLILGATSAIAHETAKCFAAEGAALCLVGRSAEKLAACERDLKVAGASQVATLCYDLDDLDAHETLINEAVTALGGLDVALLAQGTLGNQAASQSSVSETLKQFQTNALSYISLLTLLANRFEAQKSGAIAIIGSVAGERGRGSNYVYGSAKGAVMLFAGGLRNRLAKAGVAVLTVKPGFVDTPMTAGMKKNPLYASAKSVGGRIHKAVQRREDVVYTPWFWMGIMAIIRSIPERLFKKLGL